MQELRRYFRLLSPDFNCADACLLEAYDEGHSSASLRKLARTLERLVPAVRPVLYLEVELASKQHGITVTPHW